MSGRKHFTLGNLYNTLIFTFHVLSYIIIVNISNNYAQSKNQCHGPSTYESRMYMMVLNTFALVGNFVLGVEFNKLFNAIVEYEKNIRTETNARDIFWDFRREFMSRVGWLLLPSIVWIVFIIIFTITTGMNLLTPCFRHGFNEGYKQFLMILIISDTTFCLNLGSFWYFCVLEEMESSKRYYLLSNFYNCVNDNVLYSIGSIMCMFIVGGLWIFERTPNTWINIVFWVGLAISAINIFAMMYKRAIYATSEICFITIIGVVTNIVASVFLFDDGQHISDKNILAMCCSNVFLLCVGVGLSLSIGFFLVILTSYFIILTISYLSHGLIGFPETIPDLETINGWFDRENIRTFVPEQTQVQTSSQTLHATTGLNVI